MTTLLLSLLAFIGWTLVMVALLLSWRGLMVLRGERKFNDFPAGERHGSDGYWRAYRAHQNCLENLVLFTPVVFIGVTLGEATLATLPMAVAAAKYVPVARVVQSLAHLSSGSQLAVGIRFTGFITQALIMLYMGASFAKVLL